VTHDRVEMDAVMPTSDRRSTASRVLVASVKHTGLALLAAAVLATTPAPARTAEPAAATPEKGELATLVQTIRANRRALIGVNLALNEADAAQFWPLYDEYEKALAPIGDRMAKLVEQYIASFATLSNDDALQLIKAYGDNDLARMQVRRSFIDRFAEILPGRTVARFYQIENKMDAVLRYDLAATIPVVEEKAAAPVK
jgi:hypothetical protein